MERKLHHESWVMEPSAKERFQIEAKNARAFLEGSYTPAYLVPPIILFTVHIMHTPCEIVFPICFLFIR